ncbi:hypothetical protein Ahy_B02g059990 [Arachis hypogaea]|uniref:At2g35280-like TPR domain-containing protein n=1 Tax=Arachis hypogaea TaxID=3818 RepID=A0A445AHN1_ARAHY|nr:hypothetical protein Ahy_B02g059990 [Arachis hypogaea]
MAGSSETNRKEGNVPVEHECPLNLLFHDIWVRIATKVASNSIHDLFNMQASCKVFLDAASSEAVYQHATVRRLTEYFWIARRGIGIELLSKASTEGIVEAGYLSAVLLLCDHENQEEVHRGVEMLESILTSGEVKRCREFFADNFWER